MRPVNGIAVAVALVLSGVAIAWGSEPALVLHVTPFLEEGCEAINADTMSCASIVVEGDSGGLQNVYVLTSDIGALAAVQFGIQYDSTVHVIGWTACHGAMAIGTPNWPDSGEGMALAFDPQYPTGTDSLVVLGCFTILDGSSGTISVTPDPRTGTANYSNPDAHVFNFGPPSLGIADVNGGGHGNNPCGLSGGGDSGDDATGGDDASGGDSGGSDGSGDQTGGEGPGPAVVNVRFRPGVLELPSGLTTATLAETDIHSSEVYNLLEMHDVRRVSKMFPSFVLADTLGTARTGEVVRLTDYSNFFVLRLPPTSDKALLSEQLRSLDVVLFAEPDGTVEPANLPHHACTHPVVPNDGRYEMQWNLHNTGAHGVEGADVDAQCAWLYTTGDSGIVVSIIDWGFNETNHEDFTGRVHPASDPWVWGDAAHGFRVASVAGAATDNDTGMAGVDWACKLLSRQLPRFAEDDSDSLRCDKIQSSVEAGASVINMSWIITEDFAGGPPRYSEPIRLCLRDAYMENVVLVAANGNKWWYPINWPAAYEQGIVAVGATDSLDQPVLGFSHARHMDVAAPGWQVLCANPYPDEWTYIYESGTSVAAPHVSGLAALLLAKYPYLYNDDIEQIIRLSADDIPPAGPDSLTGTGRINASAAMKLLRLPYAFHHRLVSGADSVLAGDCELMYLPLSEGDVLPTRRHEVRRHVDFDSVTFASPPNVWGRGVATTGYAFGEYHPDHAPILANYEMGWCGPVEGTITESGCVLRTYVYEVFDSLDVDCSGPVQRWIPCLPEEVELAYTVHGITEPVGVEDAGLDRRPQLQVLDFQPSGSDGVRLRAVLPAAMRIRLDVFDVAGRRVRTLTEGSRQAGTWDFMWETTNSAGSPVGSGVYYVSLDTPTARLTRKVLVLR